jgi:hypothetical protein
VVSQQTRRSCTLPEITRLKGIATLKASGPDAIEARFRPAWIDDDSVPHLLVDEDPRFAEVAALLRQSSHDAGFDTRIVTDGDELRMLPAPRVVQDVINKWAANAPLVFVDQYISQLKLYRGIALDVGDQDQLKGDTQKMHEVLERYGLSSSFEIYPGIHTSAVADRIQNHVIPFMSRNLCFQSKCQ